MSVVAVAPEGPVVRITLDRPDKLNAFSADLVEELSDAVEKAEASDARLIVFQGAGRGFSGGFDLSDIEAMSDGDLLLRFVRVEQLLQQVHHARIATLVLAHGPCHGAAADLVAACQWRVATPDAHFRMPGSRFGLVLGTGRLAQLVGSDAARRLVLRDKPFGADEALETRFVTDIAPTDEWPQTETRILDQVLALDVETYAALSDRQRTDTRDADMTALVQSASRESVKARVQAYLAEMKAKRGA